MANRYIFRRQVSSAAASADVARALEATEGVKVLDEGIQSIFIQGDAGLDHAFAGRFPGWTITPEHRVQVPDTRPKVLGGSGNRRS